MSDSNNVMQEMIANHEKCRVFTDENGNLTVKLRPNVIIEDLQDKLTPEDISLASRIANLQNVSMGIKSDLYLGCSQLNCKAKHDSVFRSIPNGRTDADIMFVGKTPSQYETCNFNSHSDKIGVFLSLILQKLGISRESVYFTDLIKCQSSNLDEASFHECTQHYFVKEVECIAPKIIICDGLSLLKACLKPENSIFTFTELPQEISYGKIYEVKTEKGFVVKLMAAYDLEIVLKKTGEEYAKCKSDLWQQLLTGIKSISGE